MKNILSYFIIIFGIVTPLQVWAQPAGYNWGKQILVDGTKVSGATDLLGFTMLVSFTDADLRSVANGGHVENSNGYDIIFTLADCGETVLKHQIERYNPATGEYIAWVLVDKLNANTNTNIHMYYGNSSVATDPSTKLAWNSNVAAVYHLSNNDFTDGTANGMNGTNFSTGVVTGQIGEGRSFDGSSQYINVTDNGATSLDVTTVTMSAWIYPTDYNVVSDRGILINKENLYEMGLKDTGGQFQGASKPGCWRWAGTQVIPLNTWTRVTAIFSGGVEKHYVNGNWIENFADCSNPLNTSNTDLRIGARGGDNPPGSYFKGNIDEVKITNREETADWIKTEYNNQSSPNTFYTKSVEMTATNLCITLPIELAFFEARYTNLEVELNWTTWSETENDYFEIQRSEDAINWEVVTKIDGAGNSNVELKYNYTDTKPLPNVSYYRLRQVDFNGEYSFSDIKTVNNKRGFEKVVLYPNPSKEILNVDIAKAKNIKLMVMDAIGNTIELPYKQNENSFTINTNNLKEGVYFLVLTNDRGLVETKKFVKE